MLPLHDTFVSCIGVGKEPLRIPLEDLAGIPYILLGWQSIWSAMTRPGWPGLPCRWKLSRAVT